MRHQKVEVNACLVSLRFKFGRVITRNHFSCLVIYKLYCWIFTWDYHTLKSNKGQELLTEVGLLPPLHSVPCTNHVLTNSSPFRSLRSLFGSGSKSADCNRVSGIYEMYLRQMCETGSPGLWTTLRFFLVFLACLLVLLEIWVENDGVTIW